MFKADVEVVEFIQKEIISWFRQNGRHFPWRETRDPYKVLVAELLLHQTFSLIYTLKIYFLGNFA